MKVKRYGTRLYVCAAVLILFFVSVSPALSTITLNQDFRSIEAIANGTSNALTNSGVLGGTFNPPPVAATANNGLDVAAASIASALTNNGTSLAAQGLGQTSASTEAASAASEIFGGSLWAFQFTTTANAQFALSGQLTFANGAVDTVQAVFQNQALPDPLLQLLNDSTPGLSGTIPFNLSGTLIPGIYNLQMSAASDVFPGGPTAGEGSWEFALSVREIPPNAVPEPATLFLLAAGLWVMGAVRPGRKVQP